jgi:hypothetical protein
MRSHANRCTTRLVPPLVLFLLVATSASAQSADPILAGLQGVELGVELHHQTETHLGLTAARVYQAVGDELRKAGVRFNPPPPRRTDVGGRFERMPKGYALLYFQVVAIVDEKSRGNYTIEVRFDLLDQVRLSRDSSKETVASIYKGNQLALMHGTGGDEEVLDRLKVLTREFAKAFRESNPEKNKR